MQGVWPFVSWFLRILYWKVSSAGASKIGFGVGRQLFVSIFLQIFQCYLKKNAIQLFFPDVLAEICQHGTQEASRQEGRP